MGMKYENKEGIKEEDLIVLGKKEFARLLYPLKQNTMHYSGLVERIEKEFKLQQRHAVFVVEFLETTEYIWVSNPVGEMGPEYALTEKGRDLLREYL